MDLAAIATAIAANYGTVTATSGTATESVTATAELPDTVGSLALLVYPPTGELESGRDSFQTRDHYDFPVRLLRDPLSMPARTRWLYAWASALRYGAESSVTLGGLVDWCQSVGMRIEPEGETYSSVLGTGALFDVVEVTVRVSVTENASSSIGI